MQCHVLILFAVHSLTYWAYMLKIKKIVCLQLPRNPFKCTQPKFYSTLWIGKEFFFICSSFQDLKKYMSCFLSMCVNLVVIKDLCGRDVQMGEKSIVWLSICERPEKLNWILKNLPTLKIVGNCIERFFNIGLTL